MFIHDVADEWGISYRSVYRMVKDGTLPASMRSRDRPITVTEELLDVDDSLVLDVKTRILGKSTPARIKRIIKELKGGRL